MKKPPLVLIPKEIYEIYVRTERINMILEAMTRYSEAKEPIPHKWIIELKELIEEKG